MFIKRIDKYIGRMEWVKRMMGEKKALVIRNMGVGRKMFVIKNMEDFVRVMDISFSFHMKATISHYHANGEFTRWLKKIGENELAERLRPFEKGGIGEYAEAVEILHGDRTMNKPRFSEVCGMEAEKAVLLERAVYPDRMRELAEKYRVFGGCILLYGPPGCGKTFVASALAGETGRIFLKRNMPEMVRGNGLAMRNIMEVLEKLGGGVLFIDEVESLAVNREIEGISTRMLANGMLTAINDINGKKGVVLVGATNTPWIIDPAMLRSGRMDELVYVGMPDAAERERLLRFFMRGVPAGRLDYAGMAEKAEFYSRSDIEGLCMDAASFAWKAAVRGEDAREVTDSDFENAMKAFCPTAIPWFDEASNVMFSESAKARFRPMVEEIERYKKWKRR